MQPFGKRNSRLALALLLALAPPAVAVAETGFSTGATGPWVANDQARVRLLAARAAGPADAAKGLDSGIDLGLEFELEPGWHVYWKNSGDAGYPPRLDFARTPALAGAELHFPAPQRYDLPGGLVSFGYEESVIYPISPRMAAAEGEPVPPVQARLDYLVCRAECVPHTAELTLDFEAASRGAGPDGAAAAARLAAAREALPREPGAVPGAPRVSLRVEPGPASSLLLVLSAAGGQLRAAGADLFFEVHPLFALERPELAVGADGLTFRVPFRPLDETRPMPATTSFAWTLTGLERAPEAGEAGGKPVPIALAGLATVEIPHLRTSETPPVDGIRPGFGIPLLIAALLLAGYVVHRFRRPRR